METNERKVGEKVEEYIPRKKQNKKKRKKHIYVKPIVEKVIVKMEKGIIEITIPLKYKDFLKELKKICKEKNVPIEFQGESVVDRKLKKGEDGLYKLKRDKSRVKFDDNTQGVVVWINSGPRDDPDSHYEGQAIINKNRNMDSYVGFKTDNGEVIEKRMSELEVIE